MGGYAVTSDGLLKRLRLVLLHRPLLFVLLCPLAFLSLSSHLYLFPLCKNNEDPSKKQTGSRAETFKKFLFLYLILSLSVGSNFSIIILLFSVV